MAWHLPLAYTYVPMSFESSLACLNCLAQHNCYVTSCTWLDHSACGILIRRLSVHIQYRHFFSVTLELLLVDLWIWDCPVVVLCLFGGREVPFWKFSSTNWSSRDEAPSTLKGPWTAWPWLTRTLWLWGGGMLWVTSQGPLGLFLVSFNSSWLSISISDLISSW